MNLRHNLMELEREISRRGFLRTAMLGAGAVAALDRFGEKLFAATDPALPHKVFSALGNIIIPVDRDPGWKTFEPGITDFAMNVFASQSLLAGNEHAFAGFEATLHTVNEAPVTVGYGPRFLEMSEISQIRYLSAILIGQFEIDGVQDPVGFGAGITLIATKAVFFSNYPRHLAKKGAEFQVIDDPSPVKTGWDIMRYKGPVGPQEEVQLRQRFFDAEEVPGVDPSNPYI